jgi:hypothetical protein
MINDLIELECITATVRIWWHVAAGAAITSTLCHLLTMQEHQYTKLTFSGSPSLDNQI